MFGHNATILDSIMTPHAKIHNNHVALSFHGDREAIAAKTISYHFFKGVNNSADVLSKHWGHSKVWLVVNPLML